MKTFDSQCKLQSTLKNCSSSDVHSRLQQRVSHVRLDVKTVRQKHQKVKGKTKTGVLFIFLIAVCGVSLWCHCDIIWRRVEKMKCAAQLCLPSHSIFKKPYLLIIFILSLTLAANNEGSTWKWSIYWFSHLVSPNDLDLVSTKNSISWLHPGALQGENKHVYSYWWAFYE